MLHKLFVPREWNVEEALDLDGVDSESDYEDTIATEILEETHPSELYAGFGLMNNGNETIKF